MRKLYSGPVFLHYHWIWLGYADHEWQGNEVYFRDQSNGICGSAFPNYATFTLGLHTGYVPVDFNLHESEPTIDDKWDEVVESPLTVTEIGQFWLSDFNGNQYGEEFDLRCGSYRLRVCGANYGLLEERFESEEAKALAQDKERYEITLWPAAKKPDQVIRCKSASAAYWHSVAQGYK
jgi:hypothetical protein